MKWIALLMVVTGLLLSLGAMWLTSTIRGDVVPAFLAIPLVGGLLLASGGGIWLFVMWFSSL